MFRGADKPSCQSEFRKCTGNDSWDGTIEKNVNLWHGYCDALVSFSVTTPTLASTRFDGQVIVSMVLPSRHGLTSITADFSINYLI